MAPSAPFHEAVPLRSPMAGVEALALRSGRTFPRHSHDTFGLGLILSGAQRSWSGRGTVEAGPRDVITVNPGEMHDGVPVGGERRWLMVYAQPGLVAEAMASAGRPGSELAQPVARDPVMAMALLRAFRRLADKATSPLAAEEAVLDLLMATLARLGTVRPPHTGRSPGVARALDLIEAEPARPASLAKLAAAAGLDRFALLRAFRLETGATPHAYVLQARVRLARRLLAGPLPLAEVALEAGFADQSHMTRAFARQFALTPGRYRAALA